MGSSSSKYILVIKNIHYSERVGAPLQFSFTFRTFQLSLGAFEVRTTNLQLLQVALLWWPPYWTILFVPKFARFLNSSPVRTHNCARVGSFGSSACFPMNNLNSCNIIHWRKNSYLWALLNQSSPDHWLHLFLACENIRFSSLFVDGDVSRETSPSTGS